MDNPIKLYALSTCSHCKSVKKLLDKYNVEYEFTYVDLLKGEERKATIEEVKRLNPRTSFPTISIRDKVIVGNKENEIKEALGL